MVEKWHILWVLKEGTLEDAQGIREKLQESFGLKCRLNSLRKNIARCVAGKLLKPDLQKIGRRHQYRITQKGVDRLKWFEAKIIDEFTKSPRPPLAPIGHHKEKLRKEWVEIMNSLILANKLGSVCRDRKTVEFVNCQVLHWLLKLDAIRPMLNQNQLVITTKLLENLEAPIAEHSQTFLVLNMLKLKRDAEMGYFQFHLRNKAEEEKERIVKQLEEEKAKCKKMERQKYLQFSKGFNEGRQIGFLEGTINALNVFVETLQKKL